MKHLFNDRTARCTCFGIFLKLVTLPLYGSTLTAETQLVWLGATTSTKQENINDLKCLVTEESCDSFESKLSYK